MASTSPIFILCCERSGSTLLRYILDTHPDICSPGELYLGQLTRDLRVTVLRTVALAAGNGPEGQDRAAKQEVNRILNELLLKFAHSRGKKVWCDKTPSNLWNLEDLEWAFPDARYICLYRNSLDVAHSCLEVREKGQNFPWTAPYVARHPRNYVAAMLENWVEKTEKILAFEKGHPQTCRVIYETLVADPKKALDPVFRSLGLDWDISLLDRVFETPHDRGWGDKKIESTTRIEKDRVGLGKELDKGLLALVPPALRQRQQTLNLELGYS